MLEWGGLALLGLSLTLIGLGVWGGMLYVAAEDRQERARRHELRRLKLDVQATAARYQVPVPVTFHYTHNPTTTSTYQVRNDPRPELPPGVVAPPTVTDLPGVVDLGSITATGWRPTPASILLGMGPGGKLLTVPAGDLLNHIVFSGPTGVGKTNLTRLFATQLPAAGQATDLYDPHFTPYNHTTGEDWRDLAAVLGGGRGPVVDKDAIVRELRRAALDELPARLAAWNRGAVPGAARFLIIEEVPSLVGYDDRLMQYVQALLREGRKVGLFVIMAAQDMLVSTLKTSSGVRAQFQTCYYGGGDTYSARALLGSVPSPDPPGKGVVYLKAHGIPTQLVRVPLVSNESIRQVLAHTAPSHVIDLQARRIARAPWEVDPARVEVAGSGAEVAEVASTPPAQHDYARKREAVRRLVRQRAGTTAIIEQVWGATGGRAFQLAVKEYNDIMAELVPEGVD